MKVDIPVDCRFQSNQNPVSFNCWHSYSFQSYLKPGRRYAFHQLSEITTVDFGDSKILSTVEVDILVSRATKIMSTVWVKIPVYCTFQSYPKCFRQEKLSFISIVAFVAFLSTAGVNIPVDRGVQSYQNPVKLLIWNFSSFQGYQTPRGCYVSHQLL